MKILVPIKSVPDPELADRIRISPHGDAIDATGLGATTNPFDHYALEAALRLTECGTNPKQRQGEVIVATVGPPDTEARLRNALAIGASRAIRVDGRDPELDGLRVARALVSLAKEEKVDLILMGKQAVDSETNQVGQLVAELLDWPLAGFAARIREEPGGKLLVDREVDGGVLRLRVGLPAVITVDLRIVTSDGVQSRHTPGSFNYAEGVRFASLMAARQAQQKPLTVRPLHELIGPQQATSRYLRYVLVPQRVAGRQLKSVEELVQVLANEVQVLP